MRSRAARGLAVAALLACAPGCMTGISFDELPLFPYIGTREWLTTSYVLDGVQHDSHTFVISSRGDYCGTAEAFRADRAEIATAYWSWVDRNVGWDVEREGVPLGEGDVEIVDTAARREAWFDQTASYLRAAGELWESRLGGTANLAFAQFHRGSRFASADRTEQDAPLAPAADGEGEIPLGPAAHDADPGRWQWDAAVGYDVGNPYLAVSAAIEEAGADGFAGLTAAWDPSATGDWYRSTAGIARMSRSSVHSWDLDLLDAALEDAAGEPAGGFRMWGNYYRCFVEYGELQSAPADAP